jgi:hypothetical protein
MLQVLAAGTSLPSCYLATTGGCTDSQTNTSDSSSIIAFIHFRETCLPSRCLAAKEERQFEESLPIKDRRDTHTDT